MRRLCAASTHNKQPMAISDAGAGAAIGAFGAWLVSSWALHRTRWNAIRDALGLVAFETEQFNSNLRAFAEEARVGDEPPGAYIRRVSGLIRFRGRLSRLFEPAAVIVEPLDEALGTALRTLRMAADDAERAFCILEEVDAAMRRGEDPGYTDGELIDLIGTAIDAIRNAHQAGEYALRVIRRLRGPLPTVYRLGRRLARPVVFRRLLREIRPPS